MIKHIVFFRLPETFTQKELLVSKLKGLEQKIDFIRSLEVGENFTDSPRAYDIALTVLVDTKEDLSVYATHKEHLPVVEFIRENSIETCVVDYEIAESSDDEFRNATIVKKANQYFDGQVTSRTVVENGITKTLGIMMPGSYTFSTNLSEHMEIISGKVEVEFQDDTNNETISSGEYFEVPANSSFDIKVLEVTDYCCTYIS